MSTRCPVNLKHPLEVNQGCLGACFLSSNHPENKPDKGSRPSCSKRCLPLCFNQKSVAIGKKDRIKHRMHTEIRITQGDQEQCAAQHAHWVRQPLLWMCSVLAHEICDMLDCNANYDLTLHVLIINIVLDLEVCTFCQCQLQNEILDSWLQRVLRCQM